MLNSRKNILMIQKCSPIRDFIEYISTKDEMLSINSCDSISEGINSLKGQTRFDYIFIGHNVDVDKSITELNSEILSYLSIGNTILSGSNKGLIKVLKDNYIHPLSPISSLVNKIQEVFNIQKINYNPEDYSPIPLNILYTYQSLPFDIHLKLGEGEKARYLKRFPANEEIHPEVIDQYKEKELIRVYILHSNIEKFEELIKNNISIGKKADSPHLENPEKGLENFLNELPETLDYSEYILNELGLKFEGPNRLGSTISSTGLLLLNASQNDKNNFNKMFSTLLTSPNQFELKLVSMTTLLMANMLKALKLNTNEILEKSTLACFFHKCSLKNDEQLIKFHDETLTEFLNDKERSAVLENAKNSSEIIGKIKTLPTDISKIILEQNGSHNGIGFADTPYNSSKISEIFMIITSFSCQLLVEFENGIDFDAITIINEYRSKYGQKFEKIFIALEECIKDS